MQGSGREQVVPARPAAAPLVSLLSSVPTVVYDDPHLSEGIAFEGETCGNGAITPGACATSTALPALSTSHGAVYAAPVLIHAGDQCAPFQIESRDPRGRAMRLLDAVTPQDLEAELWNGTVARAQSYLNPYLRNPATVRDLTPAGGAMRPRAALASLEQALSKSRTRPIIHASVEGAYFLPEVRLDGQVWLTKKQTIVVPGSGYNGYGPGTDLAVPGGLAATPATTGGTLAADTYEYVVTAVSANGGETTAAAQVASTTTGSTGSVALAWTAVPGAASYRVYGRQADNLRLLGNPSTNAFTDTGAAAVSAATPPTVDTSGQPAAGETWLFGTGMVDVRLSPAWSTPDSDVEAIDRDVNTARFRAMRLGVATFDPCLHVGVRMQFAANEDQAETPNTAA